MAVSMNNWQDCSTSTPLYHLMHVHNIRYALAFHSALTAQISHLFHCHGIQTTLLNVFCRLLSGVRSPKLSLSIKY